MHRHRPSKNPMNIPFPKNHELTAPFLPFFCFAPFYLIPFSFSFFFSFAKKKNRKNKGENERNFEKVHERRKNAFFRLNNDRYENGSRHDRINDLSISNEIL